MAISEKRVIAYLAKQRGATQFQEVAKALQIPKRDWTQLRRMLRRLEGRFRQASKQSHSKKKQPPGERGSHLVAGKVHGTRRGFAFLIRSDGKDDVYMRGDNLRDAIHGDMVRARLKRFRGRMEAVVEEITHRARAVVAGTLERQSTRWVLVPDDDRIARDLLISNPQRQPQADQQGHKALVRITGSDGRGQTFAELVEVLGPPDAPGVRMHALRAEFALPDTFPSAVLQEVAALQPPAAAELQSREDLSALRTFTIDPHDARDHDDAVSIVRLPQGGFELGVHIADVSHYVVPGTQLDSEAIERGTSVYLVGTVVPMLPETLSNHLCSLRPGVARLTQSALMQFDVEGKLLGWRLSRSWIVSRAKLSYQAANEIVKGEAPQKEHLATFEAGPGEATPHAQAVAWDELHDDLLQDLQDIAHLASQLRRRRFANGALELETPEYVVRHDETGRVLDIRERQALLSYSWVEEFMLMANQVVARSLAQAHLPLLWRVHEDPQFQGVEELRRFLRKLGMHWTPEEEVTQRDYQTLLKLIRKRPEKRYLMYRVLRSLQKARYDGRHQGHFGLAFKHYTHFTSPIRRYPDLLNHRLVTAFVEHQKQAAQRLPETTPTGSALASLGAALSDCEVKATEAERASRKLKVCEYLVDHIGEQADGWVSGVTEFGLFLDVPEWGAEGLIHVDNLRDDHYEADLHRTQLRGEVSGRTYRFGQRLRVSVVRADPDRRQIDLRLVS